jgi:hypothetical protein
MVLSNISNSPVCVCLCVNTTSIGLYEADLSCLPAVLLLGYPFFPESPFYLLKRERTEDAKTALAQIHGRSDQSLLDAELARIEAIIRASEEVGQEGQQKGPLFFQCFRGTNLKRTIIASLPLAAQQFIGASFVLGKISLAGEFRSMLTPTAQVTLHTLCPFCRSPTFSRSLLFFI